MHGSLEATDLIRLYASDVIEGMGEYTRGTNVTLFLMGDVYGAFTDRFGIVWQVNISGSEG